MMSLRNAKPLMPIDALDPTATPSPTFGITLRALLRRTLSKCRPKNSGPIVDEPGDGRDRSFLAAAMGSLAVVMAAVFVPACSDGAQLGTDSSGHSEETAVTSSSSTIHEVSPAPLTISTTTTAPSRTNQPAPGWQFIELPIEPLEGSTYVLGGERLLVWGGAVDRKPDVRNDGWLVSSAGDLTRVSAAPIEPRIEASGVWTGSEFIVFGGRQVDGSQSPPTFLDGAILNPETGSWTSIPPAPLEPGMRTSAAWTGSRLVIWIATPASDADAGQFAVYDRESGSWEVLPSPDITLADANVFATDQGLTVLGGPNMGSQMFTQEYLVAATFDFETEQWAAYEFAYTTQASAARIGAHAFLAVTAEGRVGEFDGAGWTERGTVPPSLLFPLKVTAGGGEIYILGDKTYRLVDREEVERILDYRSVASDFTGASIASDRGRLVALGPAVDEQGQHTGPMNLSIYNPPN